MSGGDDWQVGDRALCVRDLGPRVPVRKGGVYQVRKVWDAIYGPPRKAIGLDFDHYSGDRAIASRCFVRIPPLTDEETAAFTADLRDCLRTPAKHTA
jgi:hypothetical protein